MKEIEVNIYSIVGTGFCVDAEDGEKVYEIIKQILEQGNKAIIDFLNADMLTSAFLNTAIGRLYRDFDEINLKKSLSTKNISSEDKLLLKRVVDTAKVFYKKNSQKFAEEIKTVLSALVALPNSVD